MRVVTRFVACFAVLAGLTLATAPPAAAQAPNNPVGLWRLSGFNDDAPDMPSVGTQDICFLPDGTWFGTTFPAWGGRWFQKGNNVAGNGDRVRLAGNYADGDGNDSAELEFVNLKLMTGPWTEWRDKFSHLLWIRIEATRVGHCDNKVPNDLSSDELSDEGTNPLDKLGTQTSR